MRIQEGEKARWGYGFVWYHYATREIEVFPVPFNILFRGFRNLYHFLAKGVRSKKEQEIYQSGFREGEESGIIEGRRSERKAQEGRFDQFIKEITE